jgi:predicted GNAT family acetyltransferase
MVIYLNEIIIGGRLQMAGDLLVKLYDLPDCLENIKKLELDGIKIKKAMSLDKHTIIDFIKNDFNINWANECDAAFSNKPISCYIAVKNNKVIGFACYEATAKGFFGPTGVNENYRGLGIGKTLLVKSLLSMKEDGYAYAIIGWVGDENFVFYQKTVHAIAIENSLPGVYGDMINI